MRTKDFSTVFGPKEFPKTIGDKPNKDIPTVLGQETPKQ